MELVVELELFIFHKREDRMKIPQREDVVGLEAPRTQSGRAVQPVEGSLGDSYITAMRGMSKELNELSALQFDLAKNAMEGQINSFDIYVNARTKQYNEELALARNNEQIDKLLGDYERDIANTGTEMLGEKNYQGWYNAKGGITLAGSVYAANLTNAQLQIKLNNERLDNQGRELNTLAGTAQTAEERQEYVDQYYAILEQNVKNGTINEAQLQEKKQEFNYNLTTSLVIKSMEDDPEATAQRLRNDKNFAPILTFPDRLRLAEQAEQVAIRRQGTSAAKPVEDTSDIWVNLWQANPVDGTFIVEVEKDGQKVKQKQVSVLEYYDPVTKKTEKIQGSYNDIAIAVYDISHRSLPTTRYLMQSLYKLAGKDVPIENISINDALKFRKLMTSDYLGDRESPQYRDFNAKDDSVQSQYNVDSMFYGTKKDKKEKIASQATDVNFVARFKAGQLINITNMTALVQHANSVNGMVNSETNAPYINRDKAVEQKYADMRNNYTDCLVYSIQNPKSSVRPLSIPEKEMQAFIKPILDRIDTYYMDFDRDQKKRNFMQGLMDNVDLTKTFDPSSKEEYYAAPKNTAFTNALDVALKNAGVSDDFISEISVTPFKGPKKTKQEGMSGIEFQSRYGLGQF